MACFSSYVGLAGAVACFSSAAEMSLGALPAHQKSKQKSKLATQKASPVQALVLE